MKNKINKKARFSGETHPPSPLSSQERGVARVTVPGGEFIILLLFLFFINPLFAQTHYAEMKNPAQFRKNLNEVTKQTNTMQSAFTQEKNLSVISEKVVSKGKFYFRKDRQLRWEYTEPFIYCVIMNNDQVYIKDEKKENKFDARSNRMFREINSIIVGCINGTILNDEKNFRVQLQESNDAYLVHLFPKSPQMKDFLSEIRIWFDRLSYNVRELDMMEASGDDTHINFNGIKTNQPLADELFQIR
jgi:outer membrane lipoprotein-sorting protein